MSEKLLDVEIGKRRRGLGAERGLRGKRNNENDQGQVLSRAVEGKTPEAVVKVTGYKKGTLHRVKEHINYITRNGELPLEMHSGEERQGKGVAQKVVREWKSFLGEELTDGDPKKERDRKAVGLVVSSTYGTDPELFKKAVQEFTLLHFGKVAPYAYSIHEDTKYAHAHIVMPMRGYDGRKLRIGRDEIQTMREAWARTAVEYGIPVVATARVSRGDKEAMMQSRSSVQWHLAQRGIVSTKYKNEFMSAVIADYTGEREKLERSWKERWETARAQHEKLSAHYELSAKNSTYPESEKYFKRQQIHRRLSERPLPPASKWSSHLKDAADELKRSEKMSGEKEAPPMLKAYADAIAKARGSEPVPERARLGDVRRYIVEALSEKAAMTKQSGLGKTKTKGKERE